MPRQSTRAVHCGSTPKGTPTNTTWLGKLLLHNRSFKQCFPTVSISKLEFLPGYKKRKKSSHLVFIAVTFQSADSHLLFQMFAYTLNNVTEFIIELSIQFDSTCFEPWPANCLGGLVHEGSPVGEQCFCVFSSFIVGQIKVRQIVIGLTKCYTLGRAQRVIKTKVALIVLLPTHPARYARSPER